MIIVRIVGGLGNQMFQYAFGLALAKRLDSSMKLDLFDLHDSGITTTRQYGLSVFDADIDIATEEDVRPFRRQPRTRLGRRLQSLVRRMMKTRGRRFVSESGGYDPEAEFPNDRYYIGYWQDERYFSGADELIRDSFTLKPEFSIDDLDTARMIRESESVALHIRRGDYVTDRKTNEYHGTCSSEYYAAAAGYIADRVENPHFFVFSDDIGWAKENLKFDYPVTWVSDGRFKNYEEMILMSYCRHDIIANSSFSWWGAWLNRNPDKIVIAPKVWYRGAPPGTPDPVPESWLRL